MVSTGQVGPATMRPDIPELVGCPLAAPHALNPSAKLTSTTQRRIERA
jgi:hypothetical protein